MHPLSHARRSPAVRSLLDHLDIPVWARLNNVDMPVRLRLISHATYIASRGSPELLLSELLRALLVEGSFVRRFCDVGANFGYYGLLAKSLSAEVDVLLVEPDPENVALIRSTLARTPLRGVELHATALSDKDGEATFFRDCVSGHTGSLEPGHGSTEWTWRVRSDEMPISTTTLDAIAGLRPLDVVKIDVEGHEESVLRGASRVLERDQPVLLVECFHRDGRLGRLLEPLGYQTLDAGRIAPVDAQTSNVLAWTSRRAPEVARACEVAQRCRAR